MRYINLRKRPVITTCEVGQHHTMPSLEGREEVLPSGIHGIVHIPLTHVVGPLIFSSCTNRKTFSASRTRALSGEANVSRS